jgi:probable HAF family extracellular repeat protein
MKTHAERLVSILIAVSLSGVGLPSPSEAAQQPQYTVVDLGRTDLPGAGVEWRSAGADPDFSGANFIPSLGGDPGGNQVNAFFDDFRLPGFTGGTRVAVGLSPLPPSDPPAAHAVLWQGAVNIVITDLGTISGATAGPSGGPNSVAYALNTLGDIVGCSDTPYGTYHPGSPYISNHAFLWNKGVMQDLGAIAGNEYNSCATGVNDSHEVVGWTNTVSSVDGSVLQRAFVARNGTMYNLTFYLAGASTLRLTNALSIDCQGDITVVGYDANFASSHTHSYLLNRVGPRRSCPQ